MIDEVTAVPNAPPFIDGVVFSRGQVVPVVNLRVRFGFERMRARHPDAPAGRRSRRPDGRPAGRRGARVHHDSRRPPCSRRARRFPGLSGNYLEGIATLGDRIVLILDRGGRDRRRAARRRRRRAVQQRRRYVRQGERCQPTAQRQRQRRGTLQSRRAAATKPRQITDAVAMIAQITDEVSQGADAPGALARRRAERRQRARARR